MPADFYKNPWFLTLVAIAIWSWGYVTADDQRIEREAQNQYLAVAQVRADYHNTLRQCGWHDIAKNSHTP